MVSCCHEYNKIIVSPLASSATLPPVYFRCGSKINYARGWSFVVVDLWIESAGACVVHRHRISDRLEVVQTIKVSVLL